MTTIPGPRQEGHGAGRVWRSSSAVSSASTLLTCCGGGVGLTWYLTKKAQEVVEAGKEKWRSLSKRQKKSNFNVTLANFERFPGGHQRPARPMEQALGPGAIAGADDLSLAFPNARRSAQRTCGPRRWRRAGYHMRNGDDFLLAAVPPNAEAVGRLQMKEWRPKNGAKTRGPAKWTTRSSSRVPNQ